MKVLRFTEDGWTSEETGIPRDDRGFQDSFAVDADGQLHVLFERDWELLYATDASGSWQEEAIAETPFLLASLAITPDGRPHAVVSNASTRPEDRLFHLWEDESGWQSEDMLLANDPPRSRFMGGLASDGAGHLFVGFSDFRFRNGDPYPRFGLAYFDGERWREVTAPRREAGVVTSAASAPDGTVHCATGGYWLRHFSVALPDLQPEWEQALVSASEGDSIVQGTLRVTNRGAGRSRATWVRLYLSDDDVLDPSDEAVGRARRLRRIRPGRDRTLTVSFRTPSTLAGRRLLAVVDEEGRLDDIDRENNFAVIGIEE